MSRRLLALLCLAGLTLLLPACGDDGDDGSSAGETDATPGESDDGGDGDEGDAAAEVGLELPDGAVMAAELTADGETSLISSDSEGSCSLGTFEPDAWDVSFSTIGDDGENRTDEGPEVVGFSIEAVVDGGGSGSAVGDAGFSRDPDAFDYEYSDEEAEIEVVDDGESVSFTFTGENEEGVPIEGRALCGSPIRNQ